MSTRKSIIPEFMKNNPDDTFQFLFPLKIVLDEDKYGNSHYEVVVKNITQNEVFKYPVSPEFLQATQLVDATFQDYRPLHSG